MSDAVGLEAKLASIDLSQRSTSPASTSDPSPALTHKSIRSISNLDVDLSLSSALSALIDHLILPLNRSYPPTVLSTLRLHLTSILTDLFSPSWDIQHPQLGSAFRSLICDLRHGLPRPLKQSAQESGIDEKLWRTVLSKPLAEDASVRDRQWAIQWEAWCDPGTVIWRYGGWEWEDAGNDPVKVIRESYQIIWSAAASPKPNPPRPSGSATTETKPGTPSRPSHAIPIRAPVALPAVYAIPPTPAADLSGSTLGGAGTDLLPAASFSRSPSPAHSDGSSAYTSTSSHSEGFVSAHGTSQTSIDAVEIAKPPSRGSHRGSGSGSTSSLDSDNSGPTQPITPYASNTSTEIFSSQILPDPKGINKGASSPSVVDDSQHVTRGRDPSPTTPREGEVTSAGSTPTPTVTPYDGGNVTVLGGGIKLGGMSRPGSVAPRSRTPHDRSRSPSISLASRALSSAMGPGGRKQRTRRRIMPTYLGHLGQPGVGGPVMGAFGMPHGGMPQNAWPVSNTVGVGLGVGVGVGPPPINPRGTGGGMPRMGS